MALAQFIPLISGVENRLPDWEKTLLKIDESILTNRKNGQDRTVKQILGHMVDSVSNNTHRIIHLQYQESPVRYPNYASYGNNDRWISIQNYQGEDWFELVQLWKYSHIHFLHVVKQIGEKSLNKVWVADKETDLVRLEDMVIDFLRHFELHLNEINELINA